jgi:hypothetical protein
MRAALSADELRQLETICLKLASPAAPLPRRPTTRTGTTTHDHS